MRKGNNRAPDAWEWPDEQDIEVCSEERIDEIIEPPSLTNNRDSNVYWVPEMNSHKYSWSKTIPFNQF